MSELVDNFRYLCVIFSSSRSFDLCVDTLTKSGQKAMMDRAHILVVRYGVINDMTASKGPC